MILRRICCWGYDRSRELASFGLCDGFLYKLRWAEPLGDPTSWGCVPVGLAEGERS